MKGPREIVSDNDTKEFEAADKLNLFVTDLKEGLREKFLTRDDHCLDLQF